MIYLKNSDILYGKYQTNNMDSNLLNNVKNIIAKSNSNTNSLQLEVIHVITWKDLKIDPTRSEVLIKDKIAFLPVYSQLRH